MKSSQFSYLAFLTLITLSSFAQKQVLTKPEHKGSGAYRIGQIHIPTRWAKDVTPDNALKEYPRPQFERGNWQTLNGLWEYAITDSIASKPIFFDGYILVPYPLESALSGVQKALMPDKVLWYKRIIELSKLKSNERILLNFGAVDWETSVFINDKLVGKHSGGYQSFSFDITTFLKSGKNELVVKVLDPTDQGPNPHGKQVINPSNIYYTPSSGIWQTVWIEKVPYIYIRNLKSLPDIENKRLNLSITTAPTPDNLVLDVTVLEDGKVISNLQKEIKGSSDSTISSLFSLSIPNMRLWSPDTPFLYDLSIKLIKNSKTIDIVKSYFGMRKIDIQKDEKGTDRIFLNNKYTYNLGVLDQGYWPEGLYTAPTDEALKFDIEAIKLLGFNTIRKHIKIEPDRWYYHADKIGILVWQDFVNPTQQLTDNAKIEFEKETAETVEQLYNHPSIITWVLFNERWGAYDQKRLTEWIKQKDPSRLINGHSGELLYVNNELRAPADSPWVSSDMTDIHSYPNPRNPSAQPNKARVIGEFGGIGVSVPGHEWDDIQGWGYMQVTPNILKEEYTQMTKDLKKLEIAGLSASIYTQPFDVEGEENGLLTYDREIIKIPVNYIQSTNNLLVKQTKKFSLESESKIAANINVNDNDDRYEELLELFKTKKRDSLFLRRLVLMAIRKKDQVNTTNVGNAFIDILTQPFSHENLKFINNITRSTSDRGFTLFLKNYEKVDSILGQPIAVRKIKRIIDTEEIQPYINNNSSAIEWKPVEKRIIEKYGNIGEEVAFGRQMIFYGYEANTKNWENYGKFYILYFKKALSHPDYFINNVTWTLYEHTNDQGTLEFALNVMKYAIDKWDQSPEALDTYANILHKLNRTSEAIKWEEKALKLKKGATNERVYAETLQKMKSGLPTWPQNN